MERLRAREPERSRPKAPTPRVSPAILSLQEMAGSQAAAPSGPHATLDPAVVGGERGEERRDHQDAGNADEAA